MQDRSLQDKDVAEVIIQRLKSANVIVPFAEIARSAKEEGRKDLASLVLMYIHTCTCTYTGVIVYIHVHVHVHNIYT